VILVKLFEEMIVLKSFFKKTMYFNNIKNEINQNHYFRFGRSLN
jgi:hypothetical protein